MSVATIPSEPTCSSDANGIERRHASPPECGSSVATQSGTDDLLDKPIGRALFTQTLEALGTISP